MTPPTIRLVLLFNRATTEALKVELRSIEAMKPSEWRTAAIAELRETILRQEQILDQGENDNVLL